jgi:hypothetical protein
VYPGIGDLVTDDEMTRLILEIASAPAPPSQMSITLPESKNDVPKLVCLDMKDWVELSRAHYGKECAKRSQNALGRIQEAVDAGEIVVPVTSINLLETSEVGDPERRERLALFMVALSRNYSLVDHIAIRNWELHDAFQGEFFKTAADQPVRPRLLRWGIASAAGAGDIVVPGASALEQAVFDEVMRHPLVSARALARVWSQESSAAGRNSDERSRVAAEQVRNHTVDFSEQGRWEYETSYTLCKGAVAQELKASARLVGVTEKILEEWLNIPEHRVALMRRIPSLDIDIRLRIARDRNLQHAVDKNDMKDLLFLSSTIPYANVVVTEKTWGHIVTASRLAGAYATRVCRNVGELVEVLGALQAG